MLFYIEIYIFVACYNVKTSVGGGDGNGSGNHGKAKKLWFCDFCVSKTENVSNKIEHFLLNVKVRLLNVVFDIYNFLVIS